MLTAFFKLCSEDDFARTLAYDKIPGGTTLNQVTKQETVVERAKKRRSGQSQRIHPYNSECFHLRILLHVVKGLTSFISLRTFQGITYEKFQGFCKAMLECKKTILIGKLHFMRVFYAVQLNHFDICHWPTYSLAKLSRKHDCIADVQNCRQIIQISIKIS